MQTSTPKISQIVMTGVGLAMFALAMTLDHYHPHNQGIAEITHSLYRRITASQNNDSAALNLGYVAPLPAAHPKSTAKLNDPTAVNPSSPTTTGQSLPTVTLAGGQADPDNPTDSSSTSGTNTTTDQNQNQTDHNSKSNKNN